MGEIKCVEDLAHWLLFNLETEEKRLIREHDEAVSKQAKNPKGTQYDEQIAYTSGALGEVFHIRALITNFKKGE